jgi:hypothetical protein
MMETARSKLRSVRCGRSCRRDLPIRREEPNGTRDEISHRWRDEAIPGSDRSSFLIVFSGDPQNHKGIFERPERLRPYRGLESGSKPLVHAPDDVGGNPGAGDRLQRVGAVQAGRSPRRARQPRANGPGCDRQPSRLTRHPKPRQTQTLKGSATVGPASGRDHPIG